MPCFVVKQPNQKYAIFSTIVDDFTAINWTKAQILYELCDDMGRRDADAKFRRGSDDEELTGGPVVELPEGPYRRWKFCLIEIQRVHGKALSEKRRNSTQ